MDELFSPGSFLGGLLGRNGPSSPASFGALGSGGTGPGSNAGVNNGMPMSGVGPGPTASITPAGGQNLGMLGGLLNKFGLGTPGGAPGSAPAGNAAAPGAAASPAQRAIGMAQNYLKPKPIQPAQFQPMQLQGPIQGPQSII